MKTEILRFLVCICFAILFVHVTVTPFIITRAINQSTAQTEPVCDSIANQKVCKTFVINPSNAEIYESK